MFHVTNSDASHQSVLVSFSIVFVARPAATLLPACLLSAKQRLQSCGQTKWKVNKLKGGQKHNFFFYF